jgi:GNAT superfamily N-acetyltransferase
VTYSLSVQLSIRRLGPGDESILELLARDDADFDLDTRGDALAPLSPAAAAAYLADPNVLHLIAVTDDVIAGHMSGHVLRLRAGDASEFLLYEIGVRSAYRRKGVGRALIETMWGWVRKQGMRYSWVLADNPEAVEFYRACEYEAPPDMAIFMGRAES